MTVHPLNFKLRRGRCWTAKTILPSWVGFQDRTGPYGSRNEPTPSAGVVDIVFAPEGRGPEPLTDAELASVTWVIHNEAAISKALFDALLKTYPRLQEEYGYSGEEKAALMPNITSAEDFRSIIGLTTVNVHQVLRDGIPYAGFEFGCMWDEEHGLGILMHGTRAVRIGQADTGFLLWIAEEDAENTNS